MNAKVPPHEAGGQGCPVQGAASSASPQPTNSRYGSALLGMVQDTGDRAIAGETSRKAVPGALDAEGTKATHSPLTCLGGSKFGHPGGLGVVGVLDVVVGRVVGVGGLGVEEGVGLEGVGAGEGVDGQDQLKNSKVQLSEQFT